ncbi:ankyrin repeat-containing domain protein [Xylaria scruposa]|nr:ankyrin repeat-containing domain protein [Xylaria scruposa]
MEAAGLGIGIAGLAGLFSSCIDITERWDSYKDFASESASLRARLNADRIRLQQWGQSVGINNGIYEQSHHKALDNPSIRSAVDLILQSIKDLDEDVDRLAPHLGHFSSPTGLLPGKNSHHLPFSKSPVSTTRRSRVGWALRGKGRAIMLIVSFEALVQKLYDLIPLGRTPDGTGSCEAEEEACTSWHIDAHNILVDLEKHIHNEVRKDLIDWLDAPDTKGTYYDRIEKRLEGTCNWILDRPEFRQWQSPAQEDTRKTLWINGPPGYGKTIIAARIVEHLSLNPEIVLAYYFFSSETECCVGPFGILRAWTSQLITQTEQGFHIAREKWEAATERTASHFDIKELFSTIVQKIPKCALVVDGLDECDTTDNNRAHRGSLSEFLNLLTSTVANSRAQLLIVSRNELAIRESLRVNSSEKEQLVELQIVPNDVEADATLFSQSVIDKKLSNKTEAERGKLAYELVNRCDSMFLGIKLLEDDLRGGKNLKQLQKVIDEAPNKLNHIYDRNWARIKNFDESSRLRAFSILRWAAFGRRPLTVLEITEGLLFADDKCEESDYDCEELPDSIDSTYTKTEILDLCVSLVEIRPYSTSDLSNSTVHLTHFSVRQYIICHMPASSTNLISNEKLQNNLIAMACLRYLNCGRIWEKIQPKENANPAIRAFRAYAAHLWFKHVYNVDNARNMIQLVNSFFLPTNRNWQSWRKYIDDQYRYYPIQYHGYVDIGNPLFYAALFGLRSTTYYLIDKMGLNVNHIDSSNRTALLAASSTGNLAAVLDLLEKGANANIASNRGVTPLLASAYEGHFQIVKMLLQNGADPMLATEEGFTPLHEASMNGHIEVVKLLLEGGADPMLATEEGITPLHSASLNGHVQVVKLLVENGANIDFLDSNRYTALHYSSLKGHIEVVKLLIKNGANINFLNSDGYNALHYSSSEGHVEVTKLLLEYGANIDFLNSIGWTALLCSSWEGHVKVTKLLLENGANADFPTSNRWTALHYSSSEGHVEVTKLLLKYGANIDFLNRDGYNALHYSSWKGHVEITKLLLENGANADFLNNNGWTALHYSSWKGHVEITKLLLENGANADILNNNGWTALHCSSSEGHVEVTKLLLENGAGIDFLNSSGLTALHCSSWKGHVEVTKLLLENGAGIDLKTTQDWTPLLMASSYAHIDIVKLFLGKGLSANSVHRLYGRSVLSYAAEKGDINLIRYLLQAGADPNSRDHISRTPLLYAAMSGSLETWDILFPKGNVPINYKDRYGSTMLSIATCHGHSDLVARLLSFREIEINTKDNFGRTPLSWSTTPGIRKLFADSAANLGVPLHSADGVTYPYSPQDMGLGYCDVCTIFLRKETTYYYCKICNGGDFCVCQDCYTLGASCLGDSHEMVVTVTEAESDDDDDC